MMEPEMIDVGLAFTIKEIFPDLDSKLIVKILSETNDPDVAFFKAEEANIQRQYGGTQIHDYEPFMKVKFFQNICSFFLCARVVSVS